MAEKKLHWVFCYEKYETIKSGKNKGKMQKVIKHDSFYGTEEEFDEYLLEIHAGVLHGWDYFEDEEEGSEEICQ